MEESMLLTYFTYIVECADDSFYTGVTSRLEERIIEHNSDGFPDSYCHLRRPVRLVFVRGFDNILRAIAFEKQVKGWTRAKKIALINGDIESLKFLAQCKNESHYLNQVISKLI